MPNFPPLSPPLDDVRKERKRMQKPTKITWLNVISMDVDLSHLKGPVFPKHYTKYVD